MSTTPCVSCDTCNMSCVACRVSGVACQVSPLTPKPHELESWNFERRFTFSQHMSRVMCRMSCVLCHVSCVACNLFTKCWSYLVEGLLSTGPTLSSLFLIAEKIALFVNVLRGGKPGRSGREVVSNCVVDRSLCFTAWGLISWVSTGHRGLPRTTWEMQKYRNTGLISWKSTRTVKDKKGNTSWTREPSKTMKIVAWGEIVQLCRRGSYSSAQLDH